jgi:hypothetical protein
MMNGNDLEGSGRGLLSKHYPGIRLDGLMNTTKNSVKTTSHWAKIWKQALPNTLSPYFKWTTQGRSRPTARMDCTSFNRQERSITHTRPLSTERPEKAKKGKISGLNLESNNETRTWLWNSNLREIKQVAFKDSTRSLPSSDHVINSKYK